jgi:transposase-like protein
MASEAEQDATKAPKTEVAAAKKPRALTKKVKRRTKGAAKRKAKARPNVASRKVAHKPAAKHERRARRSNTSAAERAKIVAAADREGLTALQVQKRFGVKPVTYYSWRKKLGVKGRRGRRPTGGGGLGRGGEFGAQVRAGVQARVREMLPGIVREEVGRYLDQVLGGRASGRGRGRR